MENGNNSNEITFERIGTCIYLKNAENLTFEKREHILPAALGGKKKLKQGWVSDQANNGIFSNMERIITRESVLAICRQFYGPGKRGSLTEKNATLSKIHILDKDGHFVLGYVKVGNPFQISQFIINDNQTVKYMFDRSCKDYKTEYFELLELIDLKRNEHIKLIDNRLTVNQLLIGMYKNKLFIAHNDCYPPLLLEDLLKSFKEKITLDIEQKFEHNRIEHPRTSQSIEFCQDELFRISAKIVFNYLAYIKGADFVLEDRFDRLRDWIVYGGDECQAQFIDNKRSEEHHLILDNQSHGIAIFKTPDCCLMGIVSLYGNTLNVLINLCENFTGNFSLEVFMCDWKNQIEYETDSYFKELYKKIKAEKK